MRFFRLFTQHPVDLNRKEKLLSVLACFCVIFIISLITQIWTRDSAYPILVASMGASCVILFIIPSSPLAQPWPFAGGQLLSAILGVTCAQLIPDIALATACAVGSSVFVMLLLRCLHPPGAATALAPVLAGEALFSLGYEFVVFPVAINVAIMLVLAVIINRWLLRHDYPNDCLLDQAKENDAFTEVMNLSGISEDDLNDALNESLSFVDVTAAEISKLLFAAKKHHYRHQPAAIRCRDIMSPDFLTVEYGTDVETAWALMYNNNLQAMPVIDKANRVIGIVTQRNFLQCVNLNAYDKMQDRFRAFIRRSLQIHTDKPESIGHLMTKNVKVVTEDATIIELIPFMAHLNLRQVPIVNHEKRLTGMVYQSQLIAALYRQHENNLDSP